MNDLTNEATLVLAELYGAYKNGEHLDNVKPADVGMDKKIGRAHV